MAADSFNSVVVDLEALRENYLFVRSLVAPGVRLLAVVKADAYGHGLVPAARAFARAGADFFGVAEVEEGVRLREAGISGEIVVLLGAAPEGVIEVVARGLSPVVFERAILVQLSRQAMIQGKEVALHLKLDLGMGRFGLEPMAAGELAAAITSLPGLRLAGILAHFPRADEEEAADFCREQWRQFTVAAQVIGRQAGAPPLLHMANSAALLRFPEAHGDLVRPGITLYGYLPAEAGLFSRPGELINDHPAQEVSGPQAPQIAASGPALRTPVREPARSPQDAVPAARLRPAMSLKSRVLQIKELPAGCGVSYGHRFVTSAPTRLAVLPLGYADGYPRSLSGKAEVLIGGRRVPLRGTICMNACMADITGLAGVEVGDEVLFMGRQGEEFIGADEIAAACGTISYEILCRFGAANRRHC